MNSIATAAGLPDDFALTRRAFLQTTGAGLAAATIAASIVPRAVFVSAAQEDRRAGFAFVGLGGYATRQMMPAVNSTKHTKIAALVSGSPDKLQRFGEQYAIPEKSRYSYENFDALRDNPDVDVIYIVLPTGLHAEYAIRAAKAGKHVMCEKPMASTAEECRQMIAAAKDAGKKLMIGYRCHTEPYNLEAVRICKERELGELRQIVTDMGFPMGGKSWRLDKKLGGGGSLYDIGIYGLNACRYLSGEEPVEVTAQTYRPENDPRFATIEESCNFQFKFPSGVLASNSTSYNYANQNRIRCICTQGEFLMDPATAYGGLKLTVYRNGKAEERKLQEVNQFATEMDRFADSILNGTPLRSPGEEGLKDIVLIEAIYKSAQSGSVVRMGNTGG